MQSVAMPPTVARTSLRKMPNAPEMISSPPVADQPARPIMNARRYSTTCTRDSQVRGIRTSVTRPWVTVEPLAMRMTPPAATTWSGWSAKGRETCSRESGSRMESASTMQTSSLRAMLMPTLSASALPPFSLVTRTRLWLPFGER
jgi:hypothetical protein